MRTLSLKELTEQLGIDYIIEIGDHVDKIRQLLNRKLDISFYEYKDNFEVREKDRVILLIDKKFKTIKPVEHFHLRSLKLFDEYITLRYEYFANTEFFNQLIDHQSKRNMSIYFYYYILSVFESFNLESDSNLIALKDGSYILEGTKYEFVYKDKKKKKFKYEKVNIIIRLKEDSEEIKVTKIYFNKKIEPIVLKLKDLLTD